jgi:hypothetical protein
MDERSVMSGMRRNLIRSGVAGVASVAVLTAAACLPAAAVQTTLPPKHIGTHSGPASTPTLPGIRSEAAAAVTSRVHVLDVALAHIDAEKDLGAGRAPLHAYLRAVRQRLQRQGRVVAADSDVAQAQRDFVDVFSGFRVYHLVLPAVSLAVRADRITGTDVPALNSGASKAQGAENHRNNAAVDVLVQDLDRQVAAATSAAQGVAATVLAYTPAQWNANNSLLSAASSAVSTAEGAIRQGRSDVEHIRQDVRGAVSGGRSKPLHHHHRAGPVSGGR